ncbi:hypothetical protein Tsubulata_030853, partial [Turnera subulata]
MRLHNQKPPLHRSPTAKPLYTIAAPSCPFLIELNSLGKRCNIISREEEKMPGLTCNACNKEFKDDAEQKLHYRSDWHRYNLKRK